MKICTVCSRTYIDDTFKFCSGDGSFLSVSYEPDLDSVMKIHPFPRAVSRTFTAVAEIEEPVVAINIAESYSFVRNADELYKCTRGFWRMKRETAEKAGFVFAVYEGVVKEVYEITAWEMAKIQTGKISINNSSASTINTVAPINFGRYQFVGKVAPEEIRRKYLERQIPINHGQSSVLYFNC